MKTRRMSVKIEIAGTDVTRDLSPYLREISYEDNLSGEADTCEIELHDVERKFIGNWCPTLGNTLKVRLMKENWPESGSLNLGEFEIDEVEMMYPPSRCRIKAVSISQNSGLRQRDESKSWEHCRLSEIAREVAQISNVELFYEATDDPQINRAEQGEQSRLAFLEKLCRDNYLALKFADGRLIIFDESKLDAQAPVTTFKRDSSTIKDFRIRATLQEIYKSCEVKYKHGKKDELISGGYDTGREVGKVLKINQKVESAVEAEKLAKNKLREKNKEEMRLTMTTVGSFELLAGNVIALSNHGVFDGNYLIEKVRHKIGGGYECTLECRKCLAGY